MRNQFSKWNSVKVKARYNYTCARCGSMENIQAHDPSMQHSDWRMGIALCGECHSKEHPDVPKRLFTSSGKQPYWPNMSARTLAKEIACHSRTIIRRAKKLGILPGKPLSEEDKQRIMNIKFDISPALPEELPEKYIKLPEGWIGEMECLRCGHKWLRRVPHLPKRCPHCFSPYWNKPRRDKGK
jgi:hypothetical protein